MTEEPAPILLRLRVNGADRETPAWPMERLLDVLRDRLRLTGTKEGCGEGECGACAVLLDGLLVNSCLVPAIEAQGREVTTVEGLLEDPLIHRFHDHGAVQCGICTPGMVVAAKAAGSTAHPAREALAGNLCRCTGYAPILAVVRGAKPS